MKKLFILVVPLLIQSEGRAVTLDCNFGMDFGVAIVNLFSFKCVDKVNHRNYDVEYSGFGAAVAVTGTAAKITCSAPDGDVSGTYYGLNFGVGAFPVPGGGAGTFAGRQGSCSLIMGHIGWVAKATVGALSINEAKAR